MLKIYLYIFAIIALNFASSGAELMRPCVNNAVSCVADTLAKASLCNAKSLASLKDALPQKLIIPFTELQVTAENTNIEVLDLNKGVIKDFSYDLVSKQAVLKINFAMLTLKSQLKLTWLKPSGKSAVFLSADTITASDLTVTIIFSDYRKFDLCSSKISAELKGIPKGGYKNSKLIPEKGTDPNDLKPFIALISDHQQYVKNETLNVKSEMVGKAYMNSQLCKFA